MHALVSLETALSLIFQPVQLLHLIAGVLLGLSVGIFPGLGGIAGLSLVLPFIYGMDPISGLALMVGLVAVIPTSDTFSSVLMGIPGSSASQATVLDGFPLARKGEAARALSAAFISSLFGGLFGAVVLTGFILLARPIVLAFGLPEMLMVTLLGLSMVAILAGRVPMKGVVSAALGILVGTVGAAGAGGSARMSSYELPYLYDGFKLVIVGLGIFAIPEIITLLRQGSAISEEARLGAGWHQGIRDWWHHRWLSLRCSTIGVIIGVIPGLGGSVVDWIAYGHTVQTSKDKDNFGSGDIRGVIGPESSNNAKEGGGLIPTLMFGIPGSGSMAIFIGGMAMLGYEAGPRMITNELDVTYTMVWSLALANVLGAGLCIALSGWIARLTTIPFAILAPFLFMLIAFAAFQSAQDLDDLITLFGFGLLGILLRRFEWSRPAFLIGFVLSDQIEIYLNQAFQIASLRFKHGFTEGMGYIFSPIVLVILAITVISVVLGLRQARMIRSEGQVPVGSKRAPMLFTLLLLLYALVSFIDAMMIERITDKVLPALMSVVTVIACSYLLLRMRQASSSDALFADGEAVTGDQLLPHGLWQTLAWFAGLLGLTMLLGFIIAQTLFFLAFFHCRAGLKITTNLLLSAAGIGFILTMASLLNRDFPAGLLQSLVHLPWPFK
ncbi:tripartite tricarboxylate transporter permease [Pokkaliibacter plantistimulans]|nr:tripartite tricarboxylate transporter permease [Pokkaliibacter plantistimulans]